MHRLLKQSLAQMAGLGVQVLLDILGGKEPTEPRIVLSSTSVYNPTKRSAKLQTATIVLAVVTLSNERIEDQI